MDPARTLFGLLAQILVLRDVLSVVVQEIRLSSADASKSYVLQGEPATLVCMYATEPMEEVTEVEWERDGELVYLWTLSGERMAKGVLEGKVDTSVSSPSTLAIISVNMEMQGTFTCRVRTNGKTAHNEMYLMVIVDACNETNWRNHSNMIECTEDLNMHCVGIFPKPSPSCGIYNKKTGKFLNSIPLDGINELHNGTYELSFNRRFFVKDWLGQPGIFFRCNMVVLGTNWRFGYEHKLFGETGCQKDPPTVLNGYYNVSGTRSCWGFPSEGSKAEYHCEEGYYMSGTALYVCSRSEWVPEGVIVRADGLYLPVCGSDNGASCLVCSWFSVIFALFSVLLPLRTFFGTVVPSAVG